MAAAEGDLLFGLLALQNGLIDQDQLLATFRAWTVDRSRTLADHLVARGHLDDDDRDAVLALVRRHLKRHGGTPEASLAAVGAFRSVRHELEQLRDTDLHSSLARLPADRTSRHDRDVTMTFVAGSPAPPCSRFRVLRWHARGGLGEIFIAQDEELHREVALKQIQQRHDDDPRSRARFLVEGEITGRLRSSKRPIKNFGRPTRS
jgi:hypothetical protein